MINALYQRRDQNSTLIPEESQNVKTDDAFIILYPSNVTDHTATKLLVSQTVSCIVLDSL